MGATDKEIHQAWGGDARAAKLLADNVAKDDPRVIDKLYPVSDVVADVRGEGILIRAMNAHRLQGSHVRVTVGTTQENSHFLRVFPAVLGLDVVAPPTGT